MNDVIFSRDNRTGQLLGNFVMINSIFMNPDSKSRLPSGDFQQ